MTLAAQVEAALGRVSDPCSVALGSPLSLVDMGLVAWEVDEPAGAVDVRLWVTSPCCTFGPHLVRAAEREVRAVPGVREVCVTFDPSVIWTPVRQEVRHAPVRPQQWKEQR